MMLLPPLLPQLFNALLMLLLLALPVPQVFGLLPKPPPPLVLQQEQDKVKESWLEPDTLHLPLPLPVDASRSWEEQDAETNAVWPLRSAQEWRTRSIYQILTDRFALSTGLESIHHPNPAEPMAENDAPPSPPPPQRCSNLRSYCGGTFKGIQENLDYIEEMGFNAIWISPVPKNSAGGYHGYWQTNLYEINPHFGTAQDLKDLVRECHRRDIWVMLDVVANHMAVTHDDFSKFHPFNEKRFYHDYCIIRNYNNQREVEMCRIGDDRSSLADLDTELPEVRKEMSRWIRWLVDEFQFDAIRIDTVKHVGKGFWSDFARASGVFTIGEVLHGDPAYVGDYQNYMDSLLNFPLYFALRDVFQYKRSMWALEVLWEKNQQFFKDVSTLGTFVDNHDFERFLHRQSDPVLLRNALTYILMSSGIPIVYYGTEHHFYGGDDPANRESLWPELFQNHPPTATRQLLTQLNQLRKRAGSSFFDGEQKHLWTNDDLHVFQRGEAVAVVTNVGGHNTFWRTIRLVEKKSTRMVEIVSYLARKTAIF